MTIRHPDDLLIMETKTFWDVVTLHHVIIFALSRCAFSFFFIWVGSSVGHGNIKMYAFDIFKVELEGGFSSEPPKLRPVYTSAGPCVVAK